MENAFEVSLAKCREIIEKKLGWGSSDTWLNSDFEYLSEKIFESTGIRLSSSTLKRLWGKVYYESIPNRSTLDALAMYADFQNWLAFKRSVLDANNSTTIPEISQVANEEDVTTLAEVHQPRRSKRIGTLLLWLAIAPASLISGFYLTTMNKLKPLDLSRISFSGTAVSLGVPNTVVFKYNAQLSNADSIFIQQSWDPKKRTRVDINQHEFTTTYYYPGYYRAKLILNDSVVAEQDVYIESEGWTGIIEKDSMPFYFAKNMSPDSLQFSDKSLGKVGIDNEKELSVMSFVNVQKDFRVSADNMSVGVKFRNTADKAMLPCRYSAVQIMCTGGVIGIPVCDKGCVGEIGLMLGMEYIDGKTHDLTGFGVDFSNEVELVCNTKGKSITFLINGRKVYDAALKKDIGKVVGIDIKFKGSGYIKAVSLDSNGTSNE